MDLHFGEKYIIFVLAKRRKPVNKGFSPLFLCENGQKSGCSTKHLENFIGRSEKFLSESGFSLGEVGARIDDIEPPKVKRYLFLTLHFYHFGVTNQGFRKQKRPPRGKRIFSNATCISKKLIVPLPLILMAAGILPSLSILNQLLYLPRFS